MLEQETKGHYDSRQSADKEAAQDARQIRSAYDHDGADKAVQRLQAEVDAVPSAQRQAYGAALLRNLQSESGSSNFLPDVALAFGNAHKESVSEGGFVSNSRIASAVQNEKNPVYAEMYRQFGDRFKSMRNENQNQNFFYGDHSHAPASLNAAGHWLANKLNEKAGPSWGGGVSTDSISERLSEQGQKLEKRNKDRENLGFLAAKPELFDHIAQNDGEISRSDAEAFRNKLLLDTSDEGKRLREKFAKTPKEQERLTNTVGALLDSFDHPANADGADGSVHNDGYDLYGMNPFGGDFMTKESLARGLGYSSSQEAQKRVMQDVKTSVDANPDVQSAGDYSQTAQKRGDGPWQVAEHMLDGQDKHFEKPFEAQKLLTDVVRQSNFWTKDKQGEPKLTADNRNEMLAAIKSAEAKRAEHEGKDENNDLSRWFAGRYPEDMEKKSSGKGDVEQLSDFSNTSLRGAKDGPNAIAARMIHGQEQFFSDPHKAAADLSKAIGVKAGIHNSKNGAEQVTKENIEKVIANIEKTGNQELLDWFKKRYPRN